MDDLKARIAARRAELAAGNGSDLKERIAKRRAELSGEIVARTDDGGEVRKMSDGTLSFKSAGYATNDQARIAEIMEGATPVDLVQRDLDEERIAANPIAARVQEFNQGAPLVGEWLEEAVGVVAPEAAQNMRATSDAMERQRPGQSTALNIAGGIAYSAPALLARGKDGASAVSKGAEFIKGGKGVAGKGLRAGVVAAPAGAVEGAASLSGRADEGGRASAAGVGAALGAGTAAALGPFAALAGAGAGKLARRFKKLDVTTIADAFDVSPASARMLREALNNDDLAAASTRLRQLGDDAMLADAGPSTGAMLDAAAQTGGRALRTARQAADGRANAVGKKMTTTLNRILGEPQGKNTAARNIARRTSSARQQAYNAAYSQSIDYASNQGRAIEGALSRIEPSVLKSAVSEANEQMRAEGLRNMQIMAEIADDGEVVFREMPNVQQLDEMKKALGNIANGETDDFGRLTARGLRYDGLARDLRDAVRDAVPQYGRALKLGGDKLQEDAGLRMGATILRKNTTVEDVRDFMARGASKEARDALKSGLRNTIEESLSNVKRTIADPNTDAREAMALVKELSSRANQKKLRLVLGETKAKQLLAELDKTATALELRSAIAGNSKTAIRQSIQQQGRDEVAPGSLRRTAGDMGAPMQAAQPLTQALMGTDPASMTRAQRELFGEIADRLTQIKGAEARRALVAVRRAMNGQPLKEVEAQRIGELVGGSIGLGAYQSGSQSLETQLKH